MLLSGLGGLTQIAQPARLALQAEAERESSEIKLKQSCRFKRRPAYIFPNRVADWISFQIPTGRRKGTHRLKTRLFSTAGYSW